MDGLCGVRAAGDEEVHPPAWEPPGNMCCDQRHRLVPALVTLGSDDRLEETDDEQRIGVQPEGTRQLWVTGGIPVGNIDVWLHAGGAEAPGGQPKHILEEVGIPAPQP